jgi:hypothetical protein
LSEFIDYAHFNFFNVSVDVYNDGLVIVRGGTPPQTTRMKIDDGNLKDYITERIKQSLVIFHQNDKPEAGEEWKMGRQPEV